ALPQFYGSYRCSAGYARWLWFYRHQCVRQYQSCVEISSQPLSLKLNSNLFDLPIPQYGVLKKFDVIVCSAISCICTARNTLLLLSLQRYENALQYRISFMQGLLNLAVIVGNACIVDVVKMQRLA